MQKYSEFRPTLFDSHLFLEGKEELLVVPVAHNRDSESLGESNFAVALEMLGGESETVEVCRFGHWANGWFEIILIDPTHSSTLQVAKEIESKLKDYPVLDEDDFSEREQEAAQEVWANCYSNQERIDYIRKNRSQFEFTTLEDMSSCVRGNFFCGDASELLNR